MAKKSSAKGRAATPPRLSVSNNSDGTFTVSARHRGGFVVVGVTADEKLPGGTVAVRDRDELEKKLKLEVSAAVKTRAMPRELHFSLKGKHTVDLGRLFAITGGAGSSIAAHIHLDPDPDNPKIPPGG